jgi:hypothetical protein
LRKVLTYFVVALLFCSLCLTLTPKNAQSKTQDIKILSYSYYIDNVGILDVVGEIQNIGTDTINKTAVSAVIYGADGTLKANSSFYVWGSYFVPQQKAPFLLEFQEPTNSTWAVTGISKITITVIRADEVNSHLYPDFTTTVSSAGVSSKEDEKGTYWISGTVRNTGSQTASNLAVAATFYNSSGAVVAVGHTNYLSLDNVSYSISPSTTVSFKVGAYDTNQTSETSSKIITSYSLMVQATTPVISGSGSTSSSQPTGATQTDTSATQNDNQNLIYIAIIAVVVIVVIAALLILRKNKRKPLPPPPKPVGTKKKQNKKR